MAKKEKRLQGKFQAALGGVSIGKGDTMRISCSAGFEDSGMDANQFQALLAGGSLRVRMDRGAAGQKPLPLDPKAIPATTVEFDATCHRIGIDLKTCGFGFSFPKTAARADTLAEFAGVNARLLVTRLGDLDTGDDGEDGSEKAEAEQDEE